MAGTSQSPRLEYFTTNEQTGNRAQVVEDGAMILVQISLTIILRGCVSLAGVVTNFLNAAFFLKLGLKDSMSIGLFSLSLADCLQTLLQVTSCVCYLTELVYPISPIDLWSLGYFIFGWAINATYLVSCWITVMISLERCFCVSSPFKVKQVFTRFRCVIAILTICVIHIGLYVPIYVSHKMEWTRRQISSTDNNSADTSFEVFTVIFNDETAYLEIIFDITVGTTWLLFSQAIVIVCAVWMGYSLKSSSKVRKTTTVKVQQQGNERPIASNLTDRERRLLKVVLYLAVILIASNIPRYMTITLYHTIPGMNTGGQRNLSTILWTVTAVFTTSGCSVNFFVYLILNSKFKRVVHKCLSISDKDIK